MNTFFKTIAVLSLSLSAMSAKAVPVTSESLQVSDMDLSAQARHSLESDSELSPQAQNVNIRVKNGHATVQGMVVNENEKDLIRQKVLAIEGIHSVSDKLKVAD